MTESEHKDELERSLEDARHELLTALGYDGEIHNPDRDFVTKFEAAVRADERARLEAERRCWCGLPESAPDHNGQRVERRGSDGLGNILATAHPFEDGHDTYERARVLPAGGDALEAFRAWAKGLPRPPRQPMTPPRKCQWCEKPATTYYDPSVNAAAGTGVGTSFPACDDHSVRFDLMVNFPPARAAFEAGAEWARARVLPDLSNKDQVTQ